MSEEQVVESTGTVEATTESTAEELVQEAVTEETKEVAQAPEEDKKFAAKFAALSRREKAVAAKEKRAEQQLRQLEERMKQLEVSTKKEEPQVQTEPLEVRIRKKPFETLAELGLNYETLTKMALNDGNLTPEVQMQLMRDEIEQSHRKEIDGIKKELQDRKTREEQLEKQAEEKREAQLVDNFKGQISEFINANKEAYELAASEGQDGIELIYSVIAEDAERKLEENGGEITSDDLMSIEEAARQIEDQLLEDAKKRLDLGKIKKLLDTSSKKVQNEPGKQTKSSVTLSNAKSQVQSAARQFASDEESKREAAKLIRWTE